MKISLIVLAHYVLNDQNRQVHGGESGIRTPSSPVESVTYREHNAIVPVFPMVPVAHCSILVQTGSGGHVKAI